MLVPQPGPRLPWEPGFGYSHRHLPVDSGPEWPPLGLVGVAVVVVDDDDSGFVKDFEK